jgi:chaperonin GroES
MDPEKIKLDTDPARFKPTSNQVVIELEAISEKTTGGLFLPSDSRIHEHRIGVIVAIGPGRRATKTGQLIPMDLKIGDKVLLGRYVGADFTYANKTYRIMPEEQIYCAIDKE